MNSETKRRKRRRHKKLVAWRCEKWIRQWVEARRSLVPQKAYMLDLVKETKVE
jgi:hypothetical protein